MNTHNKINEVFAEKLLNSILRRNYLIEYYDFKLHLVNIYKSSAKTLKQAKSDFKFIHRDCKILNIQKGE